jgi:hypothetical protein
MITNCVGLAKLVVGSAVDEDGEELFPRKWNHEFMDLPVVQGQNQPTFTSDVVTKIVQATTGQRRALYALLAGGAMRIGEVFGLRAGRTPCRAAAGRMVRAESKSEYLVSEYPVTRPCAHVRTATPVRRYSCGRSSLLLTRQGLRP